MTTPQTPATNSIASATNSLASATNSLASATNSIASATNSLASATSTPAELWEKQAFGMTEVKLDDLIAYHTKHKHSLEYCISVLSDCQEMIEAHSPEDLEIVRQWINRAKYMISVHIDETGI